MSDDSFLPHRQSGVTFGIPSTDQRGGKRRERIRRGWRMSMKHIFYGGNGTTPVDSGLPLVGRSFSVDDDTAGLLRFWHYTGNGEPDPSGTKGFTGPGNNSSNPIGRGFGSMLHMVGGGDGIILAVKPNGDLMFFEYTGNGERDETGTKGFTGPGNNSGNQIGRGFHTFPHMFVFPREGFTTRPKTTIFVVNEAGDLLFFEYSGNGEQDPTGTLGFEGPNQGNQIGRGFTNFRHIVGIGGRAFLAVPQNGDLLWFNYTGHGEHDPTGANGFTGPGNNSGNQIGNGFTNFRHLFGGLTDQGRRARIIYGVRDDGALLFWRYTGNGEQDHTGTKGFEEPFEGTQIGRGF